MKDPVVSVEIAKAVEKQLHRLRLGGSPVIDRNYGDWDLDLRGDLELPGPEPGAPAIAPITEGDSARRLHVDVVSHRTEIETELGSQATMNFNVPIDIAVRQKLGLAEQVASSGRINTDEVDRLMGVTQRVLLAFARLGDRRLPDLPYAVWQSCKQLVAPHQHLREIRQFTGIVRIVFRLPLTNTGDAA